MSKKRKRILIVDDVREILTGISSILEMEGYEAITAENGIQALEVIDNNIDLVVSDILMPEMDGIELCQIIRDKFPDIKMILISGGGRQSNLKSNYDYLETAKKLTGVDTLLKKPFNPEELVSQINSKLK